MAQAVKDSFLDLERHRQLLEENIEKLRKSLLHWQIWEAEYEGLKEEILAAKSTPTREELLAIGRDYEGELVTQKELEDILGTREIRTAGQVVNLLDRRIDYVEQNVRTIQKQIETAEDKLAAATIISTPEVRNEDGLPLTEIMEELDEEGNVISSHLSTPGSMKPQLLEALQKAGVKDIPELAAESVSERETPAVPPEVAPEPVKKSPKPTKKGVKFAEDTKPGPEPEKSKTAKRLEDIMKIAKEQERPPSEPAIIPTNETAEDAALRREMLQYGMSEIGSVVAELDLEEGSDWSDDDYDEASSFDEEDAFGRSTGKLVDEELRQQMVELEKRLGVRAMHNVGKDAGEYDVVQEGIGRITINGNEDNPAPADLPDTNSVSNTDEQSPTSSTKKSVRFSEDLDISPAVPSASSPPVKKQILAAPVGDIVERTAPTEAAAPTPQKKASRFKASRSTTPTVLNGPLASGNASKSPSLPLHAAKPSTPKPFSTSIQFSPAEDSSRTVPTGPEGKVIAPTVIERETAAYASPAEPDEFDPHLLHQEVATEYHKMRNRMIQKQGGFMKEDESEIVPFTEEEGGPKKVSRFKAARLARS
ncbi:Prefoldin subunit-domain-containing protein [Rhexocercosporidium sp. MPI-PUGE-AT-0058]|nr:Prefoldin subunit-domain-containing protein [Rhexocercosporidium sp. MPI-PUGE-AT-0058]